MGVSEDLSGPIIASEQLDGLFAAAGAEGLQEILDAFWRSTEELLTSLEAQVQTQDFTEAARTAHAIKGSASNVGAHLLAETAKALEAACREENGDNLSASYESARDAVGVTKTAIEERFAAAG
ncbi:MAG: Hpt domain-containing protein [Pseudomonadota bacterium]